MFCNIAINQPVRMEVGGEMVTSLSHENGRRRVAAARDEKQEQNFLSCYMVACEVIAVDIQSSVGDRNESARLARWLVGRVLVLCLLQEKGWLYDNKQSLQEKAHSLADDEPEKCVFFGQVLQPIFGQLSGDHPNTAAYAINTAELTDGYFRLPSDYEDIFVHVTNHSFKNLLTDFHRNFKFALSEEVGDKRGLIDPEILGTIFEQVALEGNGDDGLRRRKIGGSYYTPRSVVQFMARRCIAEYFSYRAPAERDDSASNWKERFEQLLLLPNVERLDETDLNRLFSLLSLEEAGTLCEGIYQLRVCDPSCGSGAMLIGMLQEMTALICKLELRRSFAQMPADAALVSERYRDIWLSRYEIKQALLKNCLYGVDIEPEAVKLCRLRLWLSLVADSEPEPDSRCPSSELMRILSGLSRSIICADSLLGEIVSDDGPEGGGSPVPFEWATCFARVFGEKNGFDIIIGNPPYRGHGLRGNKRADERWTSRVKQLYPGSAEYKIEQYALFFELALRIAAPMGIICYVTPDSFLLGKYSRKLRRTIVEQSAVREVVQVGKDFWKSGVVGRPTITVLQKSGEVGRLTARYVETEQDLKEGGGLSHRYEQSYFHAVPLTRFRLFFSPVAERFVKVLERDSLPLGSVSLIWSGVRSKVGQENIKSKARHDDEWKRGITSSALVLPLRNVQWDSEYLHIRKEILWAGGWDKKLVESPKLMIRQTGDTLIAGLDYSGLYHLNNVHGLSLREDLTFVLQQARSLEFLCALLNSRLMRRFYHLVSLESGRTMAQTDIETLELLPLREPSEEFVDEVGRLMQNPDPDAVEQLNVMFEELYCLDDELLEYLRHDDLYPRL